MGSIIDKDPPISCDLMNGRDEFLNFARDKHHEFSSLRRAKYSSMALLYELHNQGNEKFVYTCNKCKCQMETRYHCTVCEDFDLCISCYDTKGHEHKMEKLAGGSQSSSGDDSSSKTNANDPKHSDDPKSNQANQQKTKPYIELYLNTFMHAVNCRNANCTFAKCMQFKRVVQHSKQCQKFKNSQCEFCRQLITLCIYHAKSCKDEMCQVPLCSSIKIKLKQQKALNSQAERRRMLMMNKTLRQSANTNSIANPASPGDEETPLSSNSASNLPSQIQQQQSNQVIMNPNQGQMMNSNIVNSSKNLQYQQTSTLGQHLNHNSINQNQNIYSNNGQSIQIQQQQHQQHHHQQPTITINLPVTTNQNTLIHTAPQYTNNPNQPQLQMATQQQQQYQANSFHQPSQQQQQQQYSHQQTHNNYSNNNTQLISNPSSASPSPSLSSQVGMVTNSPQHNQLNYNQGNQNFVNNNIHVSQLQQHQSQLSVQQPQQQQSTLMNSPGKAHFQPNQQNNLINRQNLMQQQQPSVSPSPTAAIYQNVQNTRIINQSNNMPNVSPHPTPTSTPTPNPLVYSSNNEISNTDPINQSQINWQQSTNSQPQQQHYNQSIINRNIVSSPVPPISTSSPLPQIQQQQQQPITQQPYQQQQQQQQQFRSQVPQSQPGQPQPQQDEYLNNLINQFKTAASSAEKSQRLTEIKNYSPAVYAKIVSQLQYQQQQRQISSGNAVMTNNQIPANQNAQQQQQMLPNNNQQWNHQQQQYNSGYSGQNQPNNQAVSYVNATGQQQIRYNTNNMQLLQQQRQQQTLMPNQTQPIVIQSQQPIQMNPNNPQMIQQRLNQQMPQQLGNQPRMMQPQMNSMNIRQQNPQNIYIQQPQQIQMSNHFQDQQMINQTKDQMLIQPQNKLNPNQQINPSDNLSQIADNL